MGKMKASVDELAAEQDASGAREDLKHNHTPVETTTERNSEELALAERRETYVRLQLGEANEGKKLLAAKLEGALAEVQAVKQNFERNVEERSLAERRETHVRQQLGEASEAKKLLTTKLEDALAEVQALKRNFEASKKQLSTVRATRDVQREFLAAAVSSAKESAASPMKDVSDQPTTDSLTSVTTSDSRSGTLSRGGSSSTADAA